MDNQPKPTETESGKPGFQVVDKRQFLNLDPADRTPVEDKPRYPSFVEELMARTAATERKFEEKKQQIDEEIARTKARLESDFERRLELDKQKMVLPFLEVLDNLQRAIGAASQAGTVEGLLKGVQMTVDLFLAKLQAIGIEPIESLNRPFDPNSAEAVSQISVSEGSRDGIVIDELERGYSMNGQLLRPARVRVGHHE